MKHRAYTVQINCDNEAFDMTPGIEIARILHELAGRIETQGTKSRFILRDVNGNQVGVALGTWSDDNVR